jgi:hypothetical protein
VSLYRDYRYTREDARMRGLYLASAGMTDTDSIVRRFACTRGAAWLVCAFRAAGSLDVQRAFAHEQRITWRQAWRIATTWPLDAEMQALALAEYASSKSKILG